MPSTRASAIAALTFLQNNTWLDRGTRAVILDLTTYNANINLFCVIKSALRQQCYVLCCTVLHCTVLTLRLPLATQAHRRVPDDRRRAHLVAVPHGEAAALRDQLGLLRARVRVHLRRVPRLLRGRGGARGMCLCPLHCTAPRRCRCWRRVVELGSVLRARRSTRWAGSTSSRSGTGSTS